MKSSNNNQVDLLLRSLARRERDEARSLGDGNSGAHSLASSDHLDADELNSYAEGVVPAAANARYTEHLADCETCRRIVIELNQAAGASARFDSPHQQAGTGFWHGFAALFTPPVLRYAIPALALTAVIAISLLALRQQQRPEFVAQNQPGNSGSTTSESKQTDAPPSKAAPPILPKVEQQTAADADSSREKNKPLEERAVVAQTPAGNLGNVTTQSSGKDSQPGKAGAESQPSFAPEPQTPAAPRPALSEADVSTRRNEQAAEREGQQRQREEDKNQPSDESGPNRSTSAKTAAAPPSSRRIDGLVAGRSGTSSKDKKDSGSEIETRTVSGRQFRREGNAWIDTAYESTRATTNVARDSEQFRALIADEPGIRAIAEHLNGVVIVVWKGRAYRLH